MSNFVSLQSLVLLVLVSASAPKLFAETTIYLVRHAEKSSSDKVDPTLNELGRERAASLARVLRSAGIDQCIATQFKRTQETLQPTAKMLGGKVIVQKAGTEKKLIEKVRDEYRDQQVLIAGHSNTVPAMLRTLGIKDAPKLGESDYDSLFVVKIAGEGKVSWLHLHYGAANPE